MPSLDGYVPTKFVNRGGGLLAKAKPQDKTKLETQTEKEDRILRSAPKNRIAPSLVKLAIPIASLNPDPQNARRHPEKNLRAVMLSLAQFGQRKTISVSKRGMIVMAG